MTVSRRRLFGLMAVAPIAAVKAVQAYGIDSRIADIEALMRAQKIIEPPMIAVGEDIGDGPYFCGAGSITWVDPDYDERTGEVLKPIIVRDENGRFLSSDEGLDEVGAPDANLWRWLAGL